jgi:hypothetical protein
MIASHGDDRTRTNLKSVAVDEKECRGASKHSSNNGREILPNNI